MEIESRIVEAINELERWEARLKRAHERRKRGDGTPDELARIKEQVAHYRALLRDMKRQMHPSRLTQLLSRSRSRE